jgi:hypothetical protein
MKKLFVSISLLIPTAAVATCYTVYDASDKVIYRSTTSPVSLSGRVSDSVQQRYPGGFMTMTADYPCPPYTRESAEADERYKKQRKAEQAEVARAAAEQTAQVTAAQEASKKAVAAKKAEEAAQQAKIQAVRDKERRSVETKTTSRVDPVDCIDLYTYAQARGQNFIVAAETVQNAERMGKCVRNP